MCHAGHRGRVLGLNVVLLGLNVGGRAPEGRALAQAVLVADSTGREFAIIVALSIGNGSHQRTTGNRSRNTQRTGIQLLTTPNRILGILISTEDLGKTEVIVRYEAIKQPLRRSVFLFPGVELECLKPRLRLRKRGLKLPKTR